MKKKKFIGIEIGGTKLQLIIGDSSGCIEQHMRYAIDPVEGAKGIQTKIIDCFEKWKVYNADDISAIGVGFGGPVNWETGAVRTSHQVHGWKQFNLKEWLEKLANKPVLVDNDANVAALGEGVHGWGKGYGRSFYMTMGSGVGGGMIINGNIYHGRPPGELEIGQLRLDRKGTTLESECSGWAINKKVKDHINKNPDSLLAQLALSSKMPEAALLKPASEKNDPAARKILEETADNIAFALSHLVHLFHPDIIIMGGGLSLLDELLRWPVAAALPGYLTEPFLPPPMVQISALRENAVPIGALELAKLALK